MKVGKSLKTTNYYIKTTPYMLPELLALQLQKSKIDPTLLNSQKSAPQTIITSINIANSKDLALQPETAKYTDIHGSTMSPDQIENLVTHGGDLEYIVVENGEKIIRRDKLFSSETLIQEYLSQQFKLVQFTDIINVKPGEIKEFGELRITGLQNQGFPAWKIESLYNEKYVYEMRKLSSKENSSTADLNLSRPHYDFVIKSPDGRPFNFNSRIKNVSEIDTHLVY